MKHARIGLFVLLPMLFALAVWFPQLNNNEPVVAVDFFSPERFWDGVNRKQVRENKVNKKIYAAVVPHHLVAGRLISDIFEELKNQNIKKIIVIGPNHYEKGLEYLQSYAGDWQTPFGKVRGFELISRLPEAEQNDMKGEHAIAGLMPYVAYYLPSAEVFSIIIKNKTTDEDLEAIASNIAEGWDENTALLASVDFSHYLPMAVADRRDELTKQILLDMEEKALYNLNNDYMDSPGSIALMFKVCKKLGAKNFSITGHTNSSIIFNDPQAQSTTSYFTGYCQER